MADKRSFGKPGNVMQPNWRCSRHGADPPKNDSGRTGTVSSFESRTRTVSSENGTCIAAETVSKCELGASLRST